MERIWETYAKAHTAIAKLLKALEERDDTFIIVRKKGFHVVQCSYNVSLYICPSKYYKAVRLESTKNFTEYYIESIIPLEDMPCT